MTTRKAAGVSGPLHGKDHALPAERQTAQGVVPVITVDGPGGSGKGTVSRYLADTLGWHFLDSGALYRLLACAALRDQVPLDDEAGLAALAGRIRGEFLHTSSGEEQVLLDGEDVTPSLRTEACGNSASRLAALPQVRRALLDWQRRYRQPPGLIADGRDMGTVVFPDARLKIFLTANAEERARRRFNQLKNIGKYVKLGEVLEEIRRRDRRDSTRTTAPLIPADDAVIIDNSDLDIAGTLQIVLDRARRVV
ncbi:MAG: (d)CMP kinase [Gammaproteobacteria bacterium]|jgi:cytidylate kinase